jgi:hypothetical protein
MLRAIPRSFLSWNFLLLDDDVEAGSLEVAWMRERARLDIDGVEYNLYRQGWLSGLFVLERGGAVLAQAEKPNPFTRRFEVTCAHHTLCLVAQSPFARAFDLYDHERQIGGIYTDHCFTRKATIDLPADMILPVKAFVFWLAVLMWRRAAQSSS